MPRGTRSEEERLMRRKPGARAVGPDPRRVAGLMAPDGLQAPRETRLRSSSGKWAGLFRSWPFDR